MRSENVFRPKNECGCTSKKKMKDIREEGETVREKKETNPTKSYRLRFQNLPSLTFLRPRGTVLEWERKPSFKVRFTFTSLAILSNPPPLHPSPKPKMQVEVQTKRSRTQEEARQEESCPLTPQPKPAKSSPIWCYFVEHS